jgi:transmembrane sensor
MKRQGPDRDFARRLLEASAWQLRLNEAEATSSPEFEEWLADCENARAWARLIESWDLVGVHANDGRMVALRQAALKSVERRRADSPKTRRKIVGFAAAAAVAIVAGAIDLWLQTPANYATAFGERRVIQLADGSAVSLDTDSEVTVHYTKNSRELHLLRGQARFDVKHDLERPFSVQAREDKVIATGTAFNVDITQVKVLVTLIEGHIVVIDGDERTPAAFGRPASSLISQSDAPNHPSVELRPGQQLAALPRAEPIVVTADVGRVVAWTRGQLIFDDEPLSEVVLRINHYSTTQITIDDRQVAALRISGSFNTGDAAGFLDIVTRYLPVQAVSNGINQVALQKAGVTHRSSRRISYLMSEGHTAGRSSMVIAESRGLFRRG